MKKANTKAHHGRVSKYGKGVKTTTVSARVPVQMKARAQKIMNNMCKAFYREFLSISKKNLNP